MNHAVTPYAPNIDLSGLITGMPPEVYHSTPAISNSGLSLVAKSPAHYRHQPEREPTPAMRFGSAVHCAVLEPDRFDEVYALVDVKDRRQKGYKDAVAEHGSEFVLIPSEYNAVRDIQNAALARPEVKKLAHAAGHRELSAFAKDPVTGLLVRVRYDLLAAAGFALDLKTARDVFEYGFSRSVATYRYHVQVALYSDAFRWITGERLSEFWLLAVETEAPYTAVPYRLDDIAIEVGRNEYRRGLDTYARCMDADEWPMYEPESNLLSLPLWATDELEDALEVE